VPRGRGARVLVAGEEQPLTRSPAVQRAPPPAPINELTFVPANGSISETDWDDFLEYAQFVRYVKARPDRVHSSLESALAFVQSKLG
jgi:hypothetical protein